MDGCDDEFEPQDERELFHHLLCAGRLHKKGRQRLDTAPRQVVFLCLLSRTGATNRSCKAAGIRSSTVHRWRKNDPDFRSAYRLAQRIAYSRLMDEAMRRAIYGVEKLVWRKGRPVIDPRTGLPYVNRVYSDLLTIFLLKKLLPEKFGDNAAGASTVHATIRFDPSGAGF